MITKRKFLKSSILGAIVGLFAPTVICKNLELKSNYPKIGYLSIYNCREKFGINHGDCTIINNKTENSPIPKDFGLDFNGEIQIQSINDKENWIEAFVYNKNEKEYIKEYLSAIEYKHKEFRFYGDFRLKYTGKNPNYQHFK